MGLAEYGSHTSNGAAVDLSGRKTDYDAYDSKDGDTYVNRRTEKNNPVLTAEEAAQPTLAAVMGQDDDWQPTLLTEQAPVPTGLRANGGELSWTDSDYALLYAIVKDGEIIAFTKEAAYTATGDGEYAVRAANEMGGLSAACAAINVNTTGISDATAAINVNTTGISDATRLNDNEQMIIDNVIFDLQGRQLPAMQRGLNIVRMSDGTTKKVMIK